MARLTDDQFVQMFNWVWPRTGPSLEAVIVAARDSIVNNSNGLAGHLTNLISGLTLQLDVKLTALQNNLIAAILPKVEASCRQILMDAPAMQGLDAATIADMLWERLEQHLNELP